MARSRNHSLLNDFFNGTPGIGQRMNHPCPKLYYQLSRHEAEIQRDLFHLTEPGYDGAQPTVVVICVHV